ncbi:MAG: LD-carboxypeptidase [Gemmatimonadota bacterium]
MLELLRPPPLRPGDGIALVSPSRPASPELVAAGEAYLERRGFRVHRAPHLADSYHYLAGRDRDRAADLMAAFLDPDIRALFCARGGYGSGRVLDRLDLGAIAAHPKIVVGFSDTTGLHLGLYARIGLVGFTGALTDFDLSPPLPDPLMEASLWRAVSSPEPIGQLVPGGQGLTCLRPGRGAGPLVPANLALLCSLMGTPFFPDLEGAILLVEDVGEYPYRLDRMLNQLRLAGVLDRLAGLVLGQFSSCFVPEEMELSPTLEETVLDHTRPGLPVLAGFPYGHVRRRLVLPVGVEAELDAEGLLLALRAPALAPG